MAHSPAGRFFRSVLVWTHGRGTLQYDIICGLILAFIFFVPKACFVPAKNAGPKIVAKKVQLSPTVKKQIDAK